MVRTVVDDFFNFKRKDKEFLERLRKLQDISKRREVLYEELNNFLKLYNVSKSEISEFSARGLNLFLYSQYLFQKEEKIDFGLCENFKMWYNKEGEQMRCKSKKEYHQINCFGKKDKCEIIKRE